ncbi:MAG TPA: DUF4142 domain-containing protein [Amycolatopsis sp.]|nr:DUF4142 domain-containing protein [Amycolatopsis sp.]
MRFRFAALLAAAAVTVLGPAMPAAAADGSDLQQSDRDLLAKAKQDLIWEGPVSRLAAGRGSDVRVRDVGTRIAVDQAAIDVQLHSISDRLGVTLPTRPTAAEQAWADQLTGADPQDFDRLYVNRMRASYGSLFLLASEVRAGTQDDAVRSFAQLVVDKSLAHLALLEGTGLAETNSLLVTASADNVLSGGDVALAAMLVAVATVATFGVVRLLGCPGKK